MSEHDSEPWQPAFGNGMNTVAAQQSRAMFVAAENLLHKAEQSLVEDEDRARRLVTRALELGYDPHEETVPALTVASYRLFEVLVDTAEGSPEGDQRWLDLVEEHLIDLDGAVGDAVVEVLADLGDDGDLHGLDEAERRRLRRLVLDARRHRGRRDVQGDRVDDLVPSGQHEEFVEGLLRVTRRYRTDAGALHVGR